MVSKYFIEFILYSFLGWVWECCYCTFKQKKWQNRGFLYGPICPIYGVGAIAATLAFGRIGALSPESLPLWELFLICAVASAVLEYTTSFAMEKLFHAVWWDYSDMPLNINGRICLPATVLFGLAGVAIVKFLIPLAERGEAAINPLTGEIGALILVAITAADLALTVSGLTDLVQKLDSFEEGFNSYMEAGVQTAVETPQMIREKQQALAEKGREFGKSLNTRQRYAMRNIKRFTSKKANDVRSWLKEAADWLMTKEQ